MKRDLGLLLSALGAGNWMLSGLGARFVPATSVDVDQGTSVMKIELTLR